MLNEASGLKGCFLKWFDVVLNQSFHIDLLLFFFLRSLSNLLSNRAFAICVYEFFIFHSRFPSTYDTLCCVLLDQLEQWFVLVLGWGHKNLPLLWSCLSWSRPHSYPGEWSLNVLHFLLNFLQISILLHFSNFLLLWETVLNKTVVF